MTKPARPKRRRAAALPGGEPELGADVVGLDEIARALLASALDPTIAIDALGKIILASDSVERVFGWPPAELIGRNISVLLPEPHRGQHDEYLANYRRTGRTAILGRTREFEVVHRDGRLLAVELSVSRADGPRRGGPHFIGSFRDITARKAAERALHESEARFHAIFEESFQYIGLLSPDGTVLEANHAALEASGVRREDVIGRPFWETRWWSLSDDTRERCKAAVAAAANGEFVRFETEHRGVGDSVRTVDFSLKPVRDASGAVVQLLPEGRDISELKRAQRNETAMLRALATVGESAAMLAHEIKNPITAVNLALRAVADQLGEDHKVVLEDLVDRMQRLEQLMRRTLTFTRPLDLKVTAIDAGELLNRAVAQMRPQIRKARATVDIAVPREKLVFEGDRQFLEEVLTNLLRNALEAKPHGVHARLTAKARNQRVQLSVDDDGPGIPDSVRATLFQPFVTTKQQGTGLGLPFCKKVIDQHGGTIESGPSSLGGARFTVELPYQ
ncbi:MAG: PAS domain S-box protein [Planctomycetes bacterium]|nr:PAS domain S-box protein [Planctomycetota bacterium]